MEPTFSHIKFENLESCAMCGGHSFRQIGNYRVHGLDLNYTSCSQCSLIQMNPRTTEESMQYHYRNAYWQTVICLDEGAQGRQTARAEGTLAILGDTLSNSFDQTPAVLEVGSGWGMTLTAIGRFLADSGRKPKLFSIEPNEMAANKSIQLNESIQLIGKDITDLKTTGRLFNLVILSHVLEHLFEPLESLRVIRNVLPKNGLLYIEVPNYYGHPCYSLYHLTCYTPSTLKMFLHKAGFSVRLIKLHGGSRKHEDYISVLTEPLESKADAPGKREEFSEISARRARTERDLKPSYILRIKRLVKKLLRKIFSSRR